MKKITIHIGTHKIGTTSVQRFMWDNRAALLDKGVLLPTSGLRAKSGHHYIAWELRGDIRLKEKSGFIDGLLAELAKNDLGRVFISSEDFEYLSNYPERLEYLDTALKNLGYETEYLAFFRNRDDYAKSLFAELQKHKMTWSEAQFYRHLEKHNAIRFRGDWYFDFDKDRFIKRWESCGDLNLTVYDFDTVKTAPGIIPQVLSHLGVSGSLLAKGSAMVHQNSR